MLSETQVASLRENGYLAIEDVLSASELAELRTLTDDFVEQSRAVSANTPVFDLEPGHSAESPQVRRIKHPVKHHPTYRKYASHEKILDIVESLLGRNLRYHNNKLNMKNPDHGSAVEWHQDWAFYPHTNDDILEVGIALDDMTVENGALLVIPGSHRGQTWDHHQDGLFVGAITDPGFKPDDANAVTVAAGGITLHHVRTVHGSESNHSTMPRRMLFIGFCAVDAWPLVPNGETLEEMDSHIVRGEATLSPRMVELPVRLSLPRVEGSSIYEQQEKLKNPLLAERGSPG